MRGLLALPLLASGALAIWPLPVSYTSGNQVLWIDSNVRIAYSYASTATSAAPVSQISDGQIQAATSAVVSQGPNTNNNTWSSRIVNNAIERTYDTLFNKNFVPWKFHERFSNFEPALTSSSTYISLITLQQNASDPVNIMKPDVGDVDESYTLSMTTGGEVTITAVSSIGLLYGLTTLTQLFYRHGSASGCAYTPLAPVEISDKPLLPWRGLNLDTARTFKPMSDIYAMIDGLSYNKMNRLHWHITDSQSWPLVIPSMPELANKGAYASFQKYSPEDVRAVQEYGALLGVEVAMEIDQPGHTASIGYSHPELIAAFLEQPWQYYALEPPAGTFKLNSTEVPEFLERLFDDLLPRLSPLTSYFHLGGDEVSVNASMLDETVRSNKTAVLQPLLQRFMDRNQDQVRAAGLTPLVWEEQLLTWNLTMPKDTIIQTWLSDESKLAVVEQGYRALVGNYDFWYLDCGHGQWLDFYPGASSRQAWPYEDYCSPRHNWRVIYSLDPLAGVPENLQHLVLGGEVHIWSEQTDTVNLHQMVWPRACAAGEVLWSGAKDASGRNRSQITASPRLSEMRERLVARGIKAEPIQV
ncbi:Glucosamine-6-phosphate isomerase (Glucosamine-6-phosphate deaminase) (GNPDA) (GlcN6P deaminase) [Vermiconidia calcicola]|uniref:Glucosamine-6-phosphate isomerase (Glucosamine-6-phosphate deaminase) (GNPDA) (GlcN6P deaminase) n=1 Tax=Vermiconidia calcicola TaxID=1690605 RepID=A0ACC3NXX3_9PEZI|nr:Glucosamine-6-phosphate isomerase (Glucosamine-6-phosphate deaminase) (GNPDA) (GlcN6P deaminase) [Vermiconidia calcicola]